MEDQQAGPPISDLEWVGRWLAGCAVVCTCGTAAVGFAGYAFLAYADPCDAYCAPGDPWTPGSWHQYVQMWALALPALLIALVLFWSVPAARTKTSTVLLIAQLCLLVGWCVFTGVIHSQDQKHYLWWVGLLLAGVGGTTSIGMSAISRRVGRSRRSPVPPET